VISPAQGRYLNTGEHKHRINAYIHQTFMRWVEFEPTIPASERPKTVHALYRAATVTGAVRIYIRKINVIQVSQGPINYAGQSSPSGVDPPSASQ
jgi:hypothetical protein